MKDSKAEIRLLNELEKASRSHSPGKGHPAFVEAKSLAGATKLSEDQVVRVCEDMIEKGLVKRWAGYDWYITTLGKQHLETSLNEPKKKRAERIEKLVFLIIGAFFGGLVTYLVKCP